MDRVPDTGEINRYIRDYSEACGGLRIGEESGAMYRSSLVFELMLLELAQDECRAYPIE